MALVPRRRGRVLEALGDDLGVGREVGGALGRRHLQPSGAERPPSRGLFFAQDLRKVARKKAPDELGRTVVLETHLVESALRIGRPERGEKGLRLREKRRVALGQEAAS